MTNINIIDVRAAQHVRVGFVREWMYLSAHATPGSSRRAEVFCFHVVPLPYFALYACM
jgi:hypothetical protein